MNTTAPAALAAVIFTVLSWASAFPLIAFCVRALEPAPLAAGRFAVAAIAAAAWLAWRRPPRPSLAHAIRFVGCGLIGIATYNLCLNSGQKTVTAGAASFIVNAGVIITAILARVFLKESLGLIGWIGSGVSLAGVALIASGQPGGLAFGEGSSLVIAAAFCQAVYFTVQRPLVPIYGALPCAAYTLLAGAIWLAPWTGDALTGLSRAPANVTLAVIALGLFPAALGYAAWTVALGHFGAARAANFLFLVPPTAMALAFLLFGETPGLSTLIGGALAIGGVVMVNGRKRR
ncbi:MAG: DMT family transporter [Elsteraceae bacterium]